MSPARVECLDSIDKNFKPRASFFAPNVPFDDSYRSRFHQRLKQFQGLGKNDQFDTPREVLQNPGAPRISLATLPDRQFGQHSDQNY